MRRATGDVKVYRQDATGSIKDFRMIDVGTSGNGTRSNGNHDLRCWNGVIGLPQGKLHILRERSSNQETVGVSGRRDKLDPEAPQVKNEGVEHVDVGLARVAASSADLSELERSSEEPERLFLERLRQFHRPTTFYVQVLSAADRQTIFVRVGDSPLRTSLGTVGAEQASTKVEAKRVRSGGDGSGRAGIDALPASIGALRGVHVRHSPEAIRYRHLASREGNSPVTLMKPG